MTVQQMREVMPNDEYNRWRAFYSYRQTVQDFEWKKAEAKRS